jgi:protein SCO1/2
VNRENWLTGTAFAVALAMLPASAAWCHEGHVHGGPAQQGPGASMAALQGKVVKISDTNLLDKDGHRVRLLSDVVSDKVVVVSFIYTSCTDVCPMVTHTLSQLQDQLVGLLESQVRLVSLTVDPARDTPAKLKAYSALYGARTGWQWLTGAASDVTEALKGFGVYSANFEQHAGVILVGDGRSGKWTRVYETEDVQRLLARTTDLLAARAHDRLASHDSQ